jgi:hypothetical protein
MITISSLIVVLFLSGSVVAQAQQERIYSATWPKTARAEEALKRQLHLSNFQISDAVSATNFGR